MRIHNWPGLQYHVRSQEWHQAGLYSVIVNRIVTTALSRAGEKLVLLPDNCNNLTRYVKKKLSPGPTKSKPDTFMWYQVELNIQFASLSKGGLTETISNLCWRLRQAAAQSHVHQLHSIKHKHRFLILSWFHFNDFRLISTLAMLWSDEPSTGNIRICTPCVIPPDNYIYLLI
mgnify:CR=1 FL=1